MFNLFRSNKEVKQFKRYLLVSAVFCGLLVAALGFSVYKHYKANQRLQKCLTSSAR